MPSQKHIFHAATTVMKTEINVRLGASIKFFLKIFEPFVWYHTNFHQGGSFLLLNSLQTQFGGSPTVLEQSHLFYNLYCSRSHYGSSVLHVLQQYFHVLNVNKFTKPNLISVLTVIALHNQRILTQSMLFP